jgi:transcriptional regulator with XRE-family HTH domain
MPRALRDPEEAAKRVKAARGYAELSREQLAERVGLSARQIKLIEERQRHSTSRDELLEIGRACNVPDAFMDVGFKGADEAYENIALLLGVVMSQDAAALLAACERLGVDPARLSLPVGNHGGDADTPPPGSGSGGSAARAGSASGRPAAVARQRQHPREDR